LYKNASESYFKFFCEIDKILKKDYSGIKKIITEEKDKKKIKTKTDVKQNIFEDEEIRTKTDVKQNIFEKDEEIRTKTKVKEIIKS